MLLMLEHLFQFSLSPSSKAGYPPSVIRFVSDEVELSADTTLVGLVDPKREGTYEGVASL